MAIISRYLLTILDYIRNDYSSKQSMWIIIAFHSNIKFGLIHAPYHQLPLWRKRHKEKDKYSTPSIPPLPEPESYLVSRVVNTNENVSKRKKAIEQIINESPTSAKSYFIAVQIYQEQDDPYAALSIYLQGLKYVQPDDPDYSSLQMEKQKLVARIKHRDHSRFFDLFHTILDYKDLLRCACVCRHWKGFMMEWPEFWGKIALETPNMEQSTLVSIFQEQIQELRLEEPIDPVLTHDILWLLNLRENNDSIQRICKFQMLALNIRLLSDAARSMSSSLKQIELINCPIQQVDVIQHMLPSCSQTLTHVSFSHNNINPVAVMNYNDLIVNDRNDFIIALYLTPLRKQTPLPATTHFYSTLTYLKIDMDFDSRYYTKYNNEVGGVYKHTAALIKKCPNLTYIFLDSYGTDDRTKLGLCFYHAIKSCPRLKNLIIFRYAYMPQTIISNINQSEYDMTITPSLTLSNNDTVSSFTTDGILGKIYKKINQTATGTRFIINAPCALRRFGFLHYNLKVRSKDVTEVLKNSHASLELLYLGYDGVSLCTTALAKLTSLGCPKLREIRISTGDLMIDGGSWYPLTSPVLVQLFSNCPALETIELDDTRWKFRYLQFNGFIVEEIAKKCPRLRHLRLFYSCSWSGSSDFCKSKEKQECSTSSQLERLKISQMNHNIAYTLVKNIVSLKYLQIGSWTDDTSKGDRVDNDNLVQKIKDILTERGGLLVIKPK
ncbi:hypothetical protein BDA99DRAFT_533004 [Phascolomyces articulosus]|uniref:F-box domain-containing protein n=1 Tax=Phascolomyces articulosus TaxID=60185 RepID=A0AAD5PI86_9FUNG|nr:hypothetical protein BDA99DRAFT_533004 [Phascolomyces articulosus]